MRRTWVYFTDTQYEQIRELAHQARKPVSELVRQIVETHYGLEHE